MEYTFVFKNGRIDLGVGENLRQAFENSGHIDVAFFAIDYYSVNGVNYNFDGSVKVI